MSLRRAIKVLGFKDFIKMGFAMATSPPPPAPVPANESLRRAKVAETAIIGRDLAAQFEIFAEMARMITGANQSMVNILDGTNMCSIGASGMKVDPQMVVPQKFSFCQYALVSPDPLMIPDLSADERFAGTAFTMPPVSALAYHGFPLNTADGVVLGTLCSIHRAPLALDDEQVRLMRQLAKATTDQILLRTEQAGFTASRVAAMLGRFTMFAPEGTIRELMGFLDYCAHGTALPDVMEMLARDSIIEKPDDHWVLTRDGADLKAELGLVPETYKGSQITAPAAGSGLDDLLEQLG